MKVLVAGATGAIGRPIVTALVRAGYTVFGMTRSESGLKGLHDQGAEGIVLDVLDADGAMSALKSLRPDAVIEELTSLPKNYTPDEMRKAAPNDRRVRLEGGRNVYKAATVAGVRRYVVQSTGFFYAAGPGLASEKDPLAVNATPAIAASVQTYIQIEDRVLNGGDVAGVALRYGFFYGPGTYQDPADGSVTKQVRAAEYPIIGSGSGVFSFVHVEDAASATVSALEAAPGIYNIVDNDPSAMAVWLPAFARWLGAPEPPRVTEKEATQAAGPDSVYYALRLRGASNARAKRELGFAPRGLEWLAGSATKQRITMEVTR